MKRCNPPTIPAHLILDPLAPVPAGMSKAQRKRLSELREAYASAMAERAVGAPCASAEEAYVLFRDILAPLRVEQLAVLALNARSRVIGPPVIVSRGDTDGADAPIRAILRAVLVQEASTFILGHNHPTGQVDPSSGDRAVTQRLVAAGRAVECPCVDHLVVGPTSFTSLRLRSPELFR